jgi:hypothetical protein
VRVTEGLVLVIFFDQTGLPASVVEHQFVFEEVAPEKAFVQTRHVVVEYLFATAASWVVEFEISCAAFRQQIHAAFLVKLFAPEAVEPVRSSEHYPLE